MKDAIKKTIALANSGRKVPALSMVKADPELAATISKMVSPTLPPNYNNHGERAPTTPQINAFKNVSQHTAQNIGDAETVMQTLPDMKLAIEILVSSILSPKDLTTTELTWTAAEGLMPPHVQAAMLARVRQHFEQDYNIQSKLSEILTDILGRTGSYPIAVIPENSIDDVINSPRHMSMEALSDHIDPATGMVRNLGVLGPSVKTGPTHERKGPGMALEAFNTHVPETTDGRVTFEGIMEKPHPDTYLHVTDNFNVLKIPQLNQKVRETRVKSMLGVEDRLMSLESAMSTAMEKEGMKRLTDRELTSLVYKNKQYGHNAITALRTQEQLTRRTIGNPLVLHLPSESVIPVFIPGNPKEQIGFFVLIDQDGNPVSRTSKNDYYQELTARLNSNGSFPSAMLNKVKSMMSGFPSMNAHMTDYSVRYYQEIVEADLLARLRNGWYGNGVALARRDEIYRIMLSRTLAKQYTQLLFIPIELMTYFAFNFSPDGVGESLLDEMKVLNSMRAMLMFAQTMAGVRNSIGRTKVDLNLDPEDPDPKKTIEIAAHEIVRSRQQYFPLGMNSPTDLVDWLQRSGLEFTFKNHPGVPALDIEFSEKKSEYTQPDTGLTDALDKKAIMFTGLSPDNIDAAFHAEFATSLVQNNLLLTKRVMVHQDNFEKLLADHTRKYARASQYLMDDLRQILNDNYEHLRQDKRDTVQNEEKAKLAVQDQANEDDHDEFMTAAKKAVQNKNAGTEATPEATPSTETPPAAGNVPYGVTTPEEKKNETAQKEAQKSQPESVEGHKQRFVVEQLLIQFISTLWASLPKPNMVTLENQMTAYQKYKEGLELAIDAWIASEFFTQDLVGNISTEVDALKKSVVAYFLRKFMAENGIFTELSELTTQDESGVPALNLFEAQKSHLEGLVKSFTENVIKLTRIKNASDAALDATGAGGTGGGGFGGEGGTGEETPGGEGTGFGEEPGLGGPGEGGEGEGGNPPEEEPGAGGEGGNKPEGEEGNPPAGGENT